MGIFGHFGDFLGGVYWYTTTPPPWPILSNGPNSLKKLLQLSIKTMYPILCRRKASGPPTADSLVQMLIQALHSQDNNLLEVSMIIPCKNLLISFIKGPYCNKCASPTNHPSRLAKLAHKHPSSSSLLS